MAGAFLFEESTLDFGQLRVTYVGDERPVVRAAGIVDRINAQTARNAAANDRIVERSKKTLADVQMREAKRGADAFIRELERTRRAERQSSRGGGVGSELSTLTGGRLGLAGGGAVAGIGAIAAGFIAAAKVGIEYKETLEKLSKSFESLLGSQSAAAAHLKELQEFAARTPFEFEDVARASQRFQNMGLAAKDVVPTLTAVGNAVAAAGGGSAQIDRVSLAISQMAAKGKVSAEEMNQLAEAGVGGWRVLEQQLGKSKAELMKMAEAGQISADTFLRAFQQAYGSGNQMQRQMETLSGAASTLKDKGKELLADAFTPMHATLRDISVELAKVTTEGWNTERAIKAMGNTLRDSANIMNGAWFDRWLMFIGAQAGGTAGAYGMASILGKLAQAPQAGGAAGINIPEQFKYKPRISDEDLKKTQDDAFRQQKDAYTADILRQQEEAQRKARQETERQADVLKGISGDYAEASVRVSGYSRETLQLEASLYKLGIGFSTLSEENKKLAQAEINRLFSAKAQLAVLEENKRLEDVFKQSVEANTVALYGEKTATDLLNDAYVEWAQSILRATGRTAELTPELEKKMMAARGLAAELDHVNALLKILEQNKAAAPGFKSEDLLKPGTAVGTAQGPSLRPLDLSNVKEDQWATYKESWHQSLEYMRQDGVDIFGDMFARIGEGWKGATTGLILDFANALNQMASQAAASVVWGALLKIVGGAIAGSFGGGKLPLGGGSSGIGASMLQPGAFVGGMASGGFVPPGKWAMTGERGPEPVFGGQTGVTVVPHGKGGGVTNVTNIYYQPRVVPNSATTRKSSREMFETLLGFAR